MQHVANDEIPKMSFVPSSDITSQSVIAAPPAVHPLDAEVDIEVMKLVPKCFAIGDEKSANWLVRRIVAARQYALHVKAWAQMEQRRAEREEMTLMFLYGRQIEMWAKDEIKKLGGRRKSINLPAGVVAFRAVGPSLHIDDDASVIQWARKNLPAAIIVVEKLDRGEIRGHFDRTGEIPDDGIHIVPAHESFSIR